MERVNSEIMTEPFMKEILWMDKFMDMLKFATLIICIKGNGKMGLLMEPEKVHGMIANKK